MREEVTVKGAIGPIEIFTANLSEVIDSAPLSNTASVVRVNKSMTELTVARAKETAGHSIDVNKNANNNPSIIDLLRKGQVSGAGIIKCLQHFDGRGRGCTRDKD